MKIDRFEDIVAWQKSKELAIAVYRLLREGKDFSFRDQMQCASFSVMNNIAEGFERKSNNEFKQFLYIAKGSCGEVCSMPYIAKEMKKISDKESSKYHSLFEKVSEILSGLISSL
jgi:four helix bundle protein